MKNLPQSIKRQIAEYPKFFQKVWIECFKVQKGETISYSELARRIGKPKAQRAVAMALKKNPFTPLIPCHRVIKSNGEIGGYSGRGGIKKKIQLLTRERSFSSSGRKTGK
jgi:O-6-methylguanine DNA methyltransferase